MTNEQMRVKIAESLGIHVYQPFDDDSPQPVCVCGRTPPEHSEPPNYPEDLNACAEFENGEKLSGPGSGLYRKSLEDVCKQTGNHPYFATAQERCEAYLRIKGLWE